jgi:hypothetical protein
MTITSKNFFRGAATTTLTTVLYTVPAILSSTVTDIIVTNKAASTAIFTIALGGVSILDGVSIAANQSAFISIKQPMLPGLTITGGASAVTVNFHISGVETS